MAGSRIHVWSAVVGFTASAVALLRGKLDPDIRTSDYATRFGAVLVP
jgi:hypothetical protein